MSKSSNQIARAFIECCRTNQMARTFIEFYRTNQMARTFIEFLQNQSDGTHVHRVFAKPIRWHARSSSVCWTNQMACTFIECLQNQSDGTHVHRVFAEPIGWHARSSSVCRTNQNSGQRLGICSVRLFPFQDQTKTALSYICSQFKYHTKIFNTKIRDWLVNSNLTSRARLLESGLHLTNAWAKLSTRFLSLGARKVFLKHHWRTIRGKPIT